MADDDKIRSYTIRGDSHCGRVKGDAIAVLFNMYRDSETEQPGYKLSKTEKAALSKYIKLFDDIESDIVGNAINLDELKANYEFLVRVAFNMGNIIGHPRIADEELPTKSNEQTKSARDARSTAGVSEILKALVIDYWNRNPTKRQKWTATARGIQSNFRNQLAKLESIPPSWELAPDDDDSLLDLEIDRIRKRISEIFKNG